MVKSRTRCPSALLAVTLFIAPAACDKTPNVGAMPMAERSAPVQDSNPASNQQTDYKPALKEVTMTQVVAAFEDWIDDNTEGVANEYKDAVYYGSGSFRALIDDNGRGHLYWAGATGSETFKHVRRAATACPHDHEVESVKPDGTIRSKVAYSSIHQNYDQTFYPKIDVVSGDEIRIRLAPQGWCAGKLPAGVTWLELWDKYAVILKTL